jgi:hypothetical protein
LHQTFAVAKIDKDHATVIATAMRPTEKRDLLAEILFVNETAVISSHDSSQKILCCEVGVAVIPDFVRQANFSPDETGFAMTAILFFTPQRAETNAGYGSRLGSVPDVFISAPLR